MQYNKHGQKRMFLVKPIQSQTHCVQGIVFKARVHCGSICVVSQVIVQSLTATIV